MNLKSRKNRTEKQLLAMSARVRTIPQGTNTGGLQAVCRMGRAGLPAGGGSGDNIRNKLVRGKYPVSNDQINSIVENELSGVKMSFHPVYNSRIASAGKTVGTISPTGSIKIKSMEIGKQYSDTKEALIDTIIHEELEARIMVRSRYSKKFSKLNTASDSVRHKYINRVIKKYFKMKGWNYGLV